MPWHGWQLVHPGAVQTRCTPNCAAQKERTKHNLLQSRAFVMPTHLARVTACCPPQNARELMGEDIRSVQEEGVTEACALKFINHSARAIKCLWVDFDGEEKEYAVLAPGIAQPQRAWLCRSIEV
jgi:hypothetical protein